MILLESPDTKQFRKFYTFHFFKERMILLESPDSKPFRKFFPFHFFKIKQSNSIFSCTHMYNKTYSLVRFFNNNTRPVSGSTVPDRIFDFVVRRFHLQKDVAIRYFQEFLLNQVGLPDPVTIAPRIREDKIAMFLPKCRVLLQLWRAVIEEKTFICCASSRMRWTAAR